MKMSNKMQQRLVCPSTKSILQKKGGYLESVIDSDIRYPIIDGIPILIADTKSIFSIDDFLERRNTTFDLKKSKTRTCKVMRKIKPIIGRNFKAKENYIAISKILPANSSVLIIGGSVKGQGIDIIYSDKSFEIVSSDVSFGKYTTIIFDAHDIPFEDATFDCVIIQAVLEHVIEPQRCVNEIHRVLKPSGLVYAETPFMQQVHGKQYDFTRFTHLGHRRLFRYFKEISSGPVAGSGTALAWSYMYFLRSFASSPVMSQFLSAFAIMTSFFLKYFDYYLINKAGSYDAASGIFFMGTKSIEALSDRDLIKQFRGIK